MFIKAIADHIVANTSLTLGQSLFIGAVPVEFQTGVALFELSGVLNESGMYRKHIAIRVFSDDYIKGDTLISSIFSIFAFNNGCTLSDGSVIFNAVPMGTPQHLGYDEHLKAVFSCSIGLYTT